MFGSPAQGELAENHAHGGLLVLIAHCDAASRDAIAASLRAFGYRTLTVESGSAALMMLRSERPALLLLDQNMPGLSGIDLLREMHGNQDGQQLPVIIMSSSAEPGQAIAALNAGADDHLVMPCDSGVLAARIERHLERAREITALRQATAALDARLIRRTLEIEDLQSRIDELSIEKTVLTAQQVRRSA